MSGGNHFAVPVSSLPAVLLFLTLTDEDHVQDVVVSWRSGVWARRRRDAVSMTITYGDAWEMCLMTYVCDGIDYDLGTCIGPEGPLSFYVVFYGPATRLGRWGPSNGSVRWMGGFNSEHLAGTNARLQTRVDLRTWVR